MTTGVGYLAAISGRDEIDALFRSATDGVFTMEADTANRCAAVVQTLIDGLKERQAAFRHVDYRIFGEFDSARAMGDGFAWKAREFRRLIIEYIDAAERLKASFDIAGARVSETDDLNAAQILRAESGDR